MKYFEIPQGYGIIATMVEYDNFGDNFHFNPLINLDTNFCVKVYENEKSSKKDKKVVDKKSKK